MSRLTDGKKRKLILMIPLGIDFIDKDRVIHEVKKSDRVEEPHIWQLKYYIWYLKQKGTEGVTGKINYPKLRKTVEVFLEPDDEKRIEDILKVSKVLFFLNPQNGFHCAYKELKRIG